MPGQVIAVDGTRLIHFPALTLIPALASFSRIAERINLERSVSLTLTARSSDGMTSCGTHVPTKTCVLLREHFRVMTKVLNCV